MGYWNIMINNPSDPKEPIYEIFTNAWFFRIARRINQILFQKRIIGHKVKYGTLVKITKLPPGIGSDWIIMKAITREEYSERLYNEREIYIFEY
jgi:hypothetical protein